MSKIKELLQELKQTVNDAFKYYGEQDTEEKQLYVMVDCAYYPIYETEILEEDDGTVVLRINGGDESIRD